MVSVPVIHVFPLEPNDDHQYISHPLAWSTAFPPSFALVCVAGDGTLDFRHAQQVLYHKTMPSVACFCFNAEVL